MSEDSKQLSVAELLARNGQQGAASGGGGGRRRRSGRGISVAELTGDLPVIPASGGGHSAHAAPEEPAYEPPAYEPAPYESSGYQSTGYQSPEYSPPAFETPAPEPVSYTPPTPQPESPSYSPMSGPISRYDPLSAYAAPELPADPSPGWSSRVMPGREMPAREMPGRDMPASRHSAPADPLSAPLPERFATPEYPSYGNPLADSPPVDSGRSGRRRRHDPDEETTEVRPLRDGAPGANGHGAQPDRGNGYGGAPPHNGHGARPGRAARRQAEPGPATAAWSPTAAPESAPMPLAEPPSRAQAPGRGEPEPPRRSARRDGARGPAETGLPAWSARRHVPPAPKNNELPPDTGGLPTSAWSLASQDQQLVSGQTVAGDLLRDGVERAERADAERAEAERGNGRGFLSRSSGERGRRGRSKRGAPADEEDGYHGLTDIHDPYPSGDLLELDEDDDDDYDDDFDAPRSKLSSLTASFAAVARTSVRRSRGAEQSEYDANRRQWMILGGQSTGAAVAGMLLFKGFERMWEMLPWVALALAMIVILGLVALVRILRRTDDILSTVIAVVVGIFVTLGPLAFLLSTN